MAMEKEFEMTMGGKSVSIEIVGIELELICLQYLFTWQKTGHQISQCFKQVCLVSSAVYWMYDSG